MPFLFNGDLAHGSLPDVLKAGRWAKFAPNKLARGLPGSSPKTKKKDRRSRRPRCRESPHMTVDSPRVSLSVCEFRHIALPRINLSCRYFLPTGTRRQWRVLFEKRRPRRRRAPPFVGADRPAPGSPQIPDSPAAFLESCRGHAPSAARHIIV
jgi:hypothetical protein